MTNGNNRVLIVGAGFAGAVYARTIAEAGIRVHVIDKRPHLAGNCYDEVHETGVRIHRYGPHLFHTSMEHVVEWVLRFGEFTPYEHSVSVQLEDGRYVPLPINIDTINAIFHQSLDTEDQALAFVSSLATSQDVERNAAEYLNSRLGEKLTNIFFRPYTKKMWALDLEEVDVAIVKRIPIRFSKEKKYFPYDTFQALPTAGYAALFSSIFDHENITVERSMPFDMSMLREYSYVFNSMPIDEFYEYRFGPLPYRSIRFHHRSMLDACETGPTSVVNFSGAGRFTRQTDWSKLPGHRIVSTGWKVVTLEEPCDYVDNYFERFYPVRTSKHEVESILKKYQKASNSSSNVTFIGRCGTYQYLDMHQVINQSLRGSVKWLTERNIAAPHPQENRSSYADR